MPLWIDNMPEWLIGTLMVGGCVGLALGGHALRQRCWRGLPSRRDHRLLLGLLVVMTSLTTLLLGLCATTGWEAASHVGQAGQREAGAIGALGRSLSVMPVDESRLARERLRAYTRSVILKEWPAMRESRSSLATWDAFDALFRALADIQPATASERALMPEVWHRMNELLRFRQARLDGLHRPVPSALWAVTVASSGLTLGLLTLLPVTPWHRSVVGLAAFVLGMGGFLAVSMDRPFGLVAKADPVPFEAVMNGMDRWDSKGGLALP